MCRINTKITYRLPAYHNLYFNIQTPYSYFPRVWAKCVRVCAARSAAALLFPAGRARHDARRACQVIRLRGPRRPDWPFAPADGDPRQYRARRLRRSVASRGGRHRRTAHHRREVDVPGLRTTSPARHQALHAAAQRRRRRHHVTTGRRRPTHHSHTDKTEMTRHVIGIHVSTKVWTRARGCSLKRSIRHVDVGITKPIWIFYCLVCVCTKLPWLKCN